jgi:hypothetical protein
MTLDSSVMNLHRDRGQDLGNRRTAQTAITLYAGHGHVDGHRGKVGTMIGRRRAFAIGSVIYGAARSPASRRISPCSSSAGRSWGIGAADPAAIVALVASNFPPEGRPAVQSGRAAGCRSRSRSGH